MTMINNPQRVKMVLLLVFLISGAAALIYQLVWVRLLGEIFGQTTYAISTVLACFMGGLAFGSWLTGKINVWQNNPVKWYIGIEVGIGMTALLVNLTMNHIGMLYQPFYSTIQDNQIYLSFIRLAISVPLVLIPTSLMGATFPVLSNIYFHSDDRIGSDFSILYAMNTLGAGIGALLTGFFLIEYLGVFSTGLMAVLLNILAAMTLLLLKAPVRALKTEFVRTPLSIMPSGGGDRPTGIYLYL